ncbi:hypothetical protein V490_00051, partial [Pseudogymnoascus sp. VKM F-3557]
MQWGKSFVYSNGLVGKEVEMLEDLVNGRRRQQFLDKNGEWKWGSIRKHLKDVDKFKQLLLLLVHMTNIPSQGHKITGLRLVNGINQDQNGFVIDMLVTQYHKSLSHFDSPKVIPRFLPERIGQLMAMYMIYVRPLTDRWEADRWALYDKMSPPSDFIWHDENRPWGSYRISRAMAKWTLHYMGIEIPLQDWRHVAVAISRKLARDRGVKKADFENDDNDDDSEQYEIPDDLAASYTTKTAENYGVTIDVLKRLTAESLEIFSQPSLKRKSAVDAGGLTPRKRPKILPLNNAASEVASEQALLKALRVVLWDDHAQFRTPQQKEAVWLAAAKETPLVAILPTGGGKSLVFMVPAMLSGSGVTIVVVPYAKLKKLQGLVLLRNLGCPFVFLTGTLPPLCQREFEEAMQLQNPLYIRTSSHCVNVEYSVVQVPLCQREFEEAMQLQNPLYIRASSHRVNVEYSVVRVKNGQGATEVQKLVESRIAGFAPGEKGKLVESRMAGFAPGEKGVIYCNSHMKCKVLAQRLGCHYYHGDPEDSNAHFLAQREVGFQAWLGGETPYIVATAALGTGIDVPGITHVI